MCTIFQEKKINFRPVGWCDDGDYDAMARGQDVLPTMYMYIIFACVFTSVVENNGVYAQWYGRDGSGLLSVNRDLSMIVLYAKNMERIDNAIGGVRITHISRGVVEWKKTYTQKIGVLFLFVY